jgi:hypothetical protein
MSKNLMIIFFLAIFPCLILGNGGWEIGVHYSSWSINLAKPYIEEAIADSFDNFDSSKGSILFDSAGNNYGIDLRYYPGGKHASFSLGISYERNNFKGTLNGSYADSDKYHNRAEINAVGIFDFSPHSFNFSFRWDILPNYRIHPFFTIGFGIGNLDGFVNLQAKTKTYIGSTVISNTVTEEKTLDDLIAIYEKEEGKSFPIGFFPIVYVSLGMKGEIADNIYFLCEVAAYDGLSIRGGLAFKF